MLQYNPVISRKWHCTDQLTGQGNRDLELLIRTVCAVQVVSNLAKAAAADHSASGLWPAGSAHCDMGGRNPHDSRGTACWVLLYGRRLSAGGSEVQSSPLWAIQSSS